MSEQPRPRQPDDEDEALKRITELMRQRVEVDRELDEAVRRAHALGYSWGVIGAAAGGMTRQGARRRWGPLT